MDIYLAFQENPSENLNLCVGVFTSYARAIDETKSLPKYGDWRPGDVIEMVLDNSNIDPPEPDDRGLYPFDADKVCEKCGYDKIETEYVNHKEGYFCSVVVGCMIPGEHMHRTCNRCGFGWVENILIKEADNGSRVDASPEESPGEAI